LGTTTTTDDDDAVGTDNSSSGGIVFNLVDRFDSSSFNGLVTLPVLCTISLIGILGDVALMVPEVVGIITSLI
jgi:hypothetical protein